MAFSSNRSSGLTEGIAAAGGAVAGIGATVAGLPLAFNIAAAVTVWGALRFLVLPSVRVRDRVVVDGLTEADVERILAEGRGRTRAIEALGRQIQDARARTDVAQIVGQLDTIFDHFEDYPHDIALAQKFLVVYLDRTHSILERYVGFQHLTSDKAQAVRTRVEKELLPRLKDLSREQYDKFLDDDLDDYDADIAVLNRSIDLEGLG